MSAAAATHTADERLLTFELAGALYALPISGVLEVAEASRVTCIPTLPTQIGGVVNYHGDALPVVRCSSLFPVDEARLCEPSNILVVTDRAGDAPRLGLPVDRVLGLVDGHAAGTLAVGELWERRSIEGRIASVIDPKRLVAQAREVIESSVGRRD
jgi:chemotaxis signal transduction protein